MKKKHKRIFKISLLLASMIGATAFISYGSSGFTKWTKEDWRDRFIIPAVDDEDDDDLDPIIETDHLVKIVLLNENAIIVDNNAQYDQNLDNKGNSLYLDMRNYPEDNEYIEAYVYDFDSGFDNDFNMRLDENAVVDDVVYFALGVNELHLKYYNDEGSIMIDYENTTIVNRPFKASDFINEAPEEAPQARHIDVGVQAALGVEGKKTLTVNVVPVNADVNLTFTSDNAKVVVTKTGDKAAEVYVTAYFANYATITVTDSISGVSGSGKVYSYGLTVLEYTTDMFQGYSGAFVVSTSTHREYLPNEVAMAGDLDYGLTNYNNYGDFTPLVEIDPFEGDEYWIHPNDKVYLHMAYNGSFAPKVKNITDNNKVYTLTNDVAKDPGVEFVTVGPVDLSLGLNNILILGGQDGDTPLAAFELDRRTIVTGVTVPDATFWS